MRAIVRRPDTLRRWLAASAAATATCTTFENIRTAAASAERNSPTKATSINYRAILEQLWIVESVPGWLPSRNQLARLTQAPSCGSRALGAAARRW